MVSIKDRIVSWYIRNVLLPRVEIIDSPGFIIENLSKVGLDTTIRQIFLPEDVLVAIEQKFVKEKDKDGEYTLYVIGKKFGYYYSGLSNLPTINTNNKDEFLDSMYYIIKYVEGTYASRIDYELNYEKKIIKFKMDNYIICRKSGVGYLFGSGGIAGIWAYTACDKDIEGVKIRCQGKGDKECEIICAPYNELIRMGYTPFKFNELKAGCINKDYINFNKIKPTKWAKNSLKSLINSSFIKYEHGQITYSNKRFFECESSFMYILEKELAKIKNGLETLWKCSFDFGKKLAQISGDQEPISFIMDFFPALGFGDILVVSKKDEYEIFVNHFPWLEDWKEVEFTMFRGMLSGVLSGFTGKEIELRKIEKDISSGSLTLYITT